MFFWSGCNCILVCQLLTFMSDVDIQVAEKNSSKRANLFCDVDVDENNNDVDIGFSIRKKSVIVCVIFRCFALTASSGDSMNSFMVGCFINDRLSPPIMLSRWIFVAWARIVGTLPIHYHLCQLEYLVHFLGTSPNYLLGKAHSSTNSVFMHNLFTFSTVSLSQADRTETIYEVLFNDKLINC